MSFIRLKSSCIPLAMENATTNEIVPTRLLGTLGDLNFAEKLFYDLRQEREDGAHTAFPFNNPAYAGNILLTGANFGAGAPAEPAILSLLDYGIKAIVASSFDPDFQLAATRLGLILVAVPSAFLQDLMIGVYSNPRLELCIDLETQCLSVPELNKHYQFAFNPFELLCGLHQQPRLSTLEILEKTLKDFQGVRAFPI